MSYQHVQSVLTHSRSKNAARMVLVALALQANDEGLCWPSVATLSRRANLSRSAAHDALHRLVKLGEVEIRQGAATKGCNLYRLLPPIHEAPAQLLKGQTDQQP